MEVVIGGRMLAQVVIEMELNHMPGQAVHMTWSAWAIAMGENCILALWWIPIERLDGLNVGFGCILGRWGLVLAWGGRRDVRGWVVLLERPFRGLEWVHLRRHHWGRPR